MAARHLAEPEASTATTTRVHGFDVLRGFSVVSMVLFHFCYDIRFIAGMPLDWFAPPLQDIWRCSISWTFVFIAGCMFAWSRDNLRRSGKYLAVAALVFVVTTLAGVDTPINYGIIYCMGSCTLVSWALDRLGFRPRRLVPACILFLCFLALLSLPHGTIGLGSLSVALPRELYQIPHLAGIGIPGPGFASADYYPTLPYLLLYLSGTAMGRSWKENGTPRILVRLTCAPLERIGQHALPIYVLHQPVLLLLTMGLQALV